MEVSSVGGLNFICSFEQVKDLVKTLQLCSVYIMLRLNCVFQVKALTPVNVTLFGKRASPHDQVKITLLGWTLT